MSQLTTPVIKSNEQGETFKNRMDIGDILARFKNMEPEE